MTFEWTDLTYQQILAGNTAIFIFPLCVLLMFFVLAAQYENLIMPLAVILIVPMSILSAVVGLYGSEETITSSRRSASSCWQGSPVRTPYSSWVARDLEQQGLPTMRAAMRSARMRLRPILMTSISFIAGVTPLVFSAGAGAEMRQAIGKAVFSGMIGVTLFGLIFTPVFYVALRKLEDKLKGVKPRAQRQEPVV